MLQRAVCFGLLFFLSVVICRADDKGVISGKWITREYGPMSGAQVLLFNAAKGPAPSSSSFLRLPDAGAPVDDQGRFSTEVPAGRYYLVMRKRLDPSSAGPPEDGTPQFYGRLKNGKPKLYVVQAGNTLNLGTITAAEPFRRKKVVPKTGMTGIAGTITDQQGYPVSGARVMAYESASMRRMPRWASDKTGEDGRYFLSLDREGIYFLKARTHYGGGKPAEGELIGSFNSSGKVIGVPVAKGKIVKEINIQVMGFNSKRQE